MINLILSLDYEIFGNGAGDVMRDVIEPTDRMLRICDKHNARLTIMFEVAEYWSFQQYDKELTDTLGFSPYGKMRQQAFDAVLRGHDVQLHIHPQWIGAELVDGLWQLKFDQWRLADLPDGLGDSNNIFSITGALLKGKKTLESIINPLRPGYRCQAFRAGGFYAQPAGDVIKAIKQVGLIADSSVVQGMHIEKPWQLDYRSAQSNLGYWWTAADDLNCSGAELENILEFPVFSQPKPYIYNFKWPKLRAALKRRELENNDPHTGLAYGAKSTPGAGSIIKKLRSVHPMTFDFCKLSSSNMLSTLKEIVNNNDHKNKIIPLMMIGHCKDFWNDKNLDKFLSQVSKMTSTVKFSTFADTINEITG
ncbi:MAG: hypothetical protein JEZ07_06335 [Phycisphaerae bacterium]|nr:hypothetical protein [Phycisphaerae bacterium]